MKITRNRIIIGVFLIIALWAISGYLTHKLSYEDRGSFGDMFGAVNALFSGLALFGIIISILIQQNELNLQRRELVETRREFKINRISNIIFNQLDQINTYLDLQIFYGSQLMPFEEPKKIFSFVLLLDSLKGSNENYHIIELIRSNKNTITEIITKIAQITENIKDLIATQDFDNSETAQFKKLFKANIIPSIYTLISYRLSILRDQIKDYKGDNENVIDKQVHEIRQNLIKIEVEKINQIMNFDN